ncbi:MAG: hypothetical protein RLZZ28_2289 [Bacteroidota bacterium]|jgi:hypothetical protein
MAEPKKLTEQESLQLITEMIQKAKGNFHENGTGPILWGTVIAVCGICTYFQIEYNWNTGWFSIWYLALIAIIPQIVIDIRERKQKMVKSHMCVAIDAVWQVYGFAIFALIFYFNMVPGASQTMIQNEGRELMLKNLQTGTLEPIRPFVLSQGSLLLLLYGIPTLITGIARNFKPMLIGGILCYVFFVISCFTPNKYDFLMNGLAAIGNWLIPGFILRKEFLKQRKANV